MNGLAELLWVARKTWLTPRVGRTYYSQFGEDTLLAAVINPKYCNGFYVDIGAYHPRKFSNTYTLYKRGWSGVNVDMDPLKIQAFNLARPGDTNVCAAVSNEVSMVTAYAFSNFGLGSTINRDVAASTSVRPTEIRTVQTRTLEDILQKSRYVGREIDVLSIDVEGHDFQVLQSLDISAWKPKIVIVESMLESMEDILRSAMYKYLVARGYRLIGWAHLSLIFRYPAGELFLKA